MKNEKCIWTGRKSPRVKPVTLETVNRWGSPTEKTLHVLPEHEQELRAFNRKLVRHARTFIYLLLLASTVVTVGGVVFAFVLPEPVTALFIGVYLLFLGAVMYYLPFATPETVSWLGLRSSIRVVQFLAIAFIIWGFLTIIWIDW